MAIFTFSGVMYRGADPEMASEVRASVLRTGTESADSTLSYEIVAQAPGELPEVIVTVEDLTGLLIDGRPSDPDLVVASLGRITWSGGITDVLVLDLDNDETHLFFIGGAQPVLPETPAALNALLNSITAIDAIPPGDPLAPGADIALAGLAGVQTDPVGVLGVADPEGSELRGGPGDDLLFGGPGGDRLIGNAGDDYLLPGSNPNQTDVILPGPGNNLIDFSESHTGFFYIGYTTLPEAGITVTLDGVANLASVDKGPNGVDTLVDVARAIDDSVGTSLTIDGTDQDDRFVLNMGPDQWMQVAGRGGDNSFELSGPGFVRLRYADAPDPVVVDLASGTVSANGFGGSDTITGTVFEVMGSSGDDILIGGPGNSRFVPLGGNDVIDGGGGFNRIRFDQGDVQDLVVDLAAGFATGTIDGEAFNHTITNIQFIRGSRSAVERLRGDDSDNRFQLEEGTPGVGFSEVTPRGGNNFIDYSGVFESPQVLSYFGQAGGISVAIDGAANTGSVVKSGGQTDTIFNVANPMNGGWTVGGLFLFGTDHDDSFAVTTGHEQWISLSGIGGNNSFTLSGDGLVRLDYRFANSGIDIDFATGTVADNGLGGADTIIGQLWEVRGSEHADVMVGDGNNNSFQPLGGNDFIDGGGGINRLRYDFDDVQDLVVDIPAGIATGSFNGVAFTDTFVNIQNLRGSLGDDVLIAGDGDHRLEGRGGNNVLVSGTAGTDTLVAGTGITRFVINDGGTAVIMGYRIGIDILDLSQLSAEPAQIAAAFAAATDAANGARVDLPDGALVFSGLTAAQVRDLPQAGSLADLNTALDVASMKAALDAALAGTAAFSSYSALTPALQDLVAADMLLNRPGGVVLTIDGMQILSDGDLPFDLADGTALRVVAPITLPLFGPGVRDELAGIPEPEAAVFVDLSDVGVLTLTEAGAAAPAFSFEGGGAVRVEVIEGVIDEDFLREALGEAFDPLSAAGIFDAFVAGAYQLHQILVSDAVAVQDAQTGEFLGMGGDEFVLSALIPPGPGVEGLFFGLPEGTILLGSFERLLDDAVLGEAFFAIDGVTSALPESGAGFADSAEAEALLAGVTGFRAALGAALERVADASLTLEDVQAVRDALEALPDSIYPAGELFPPALYEAAVAIFDAPPAVQAAQLAAVNASGADTLTALLQSLATEPEPSEPPETVTLSGTVTDRSGEALPDAVVLFSPDDGDSLETVPAEDGSFSVELPAGTGGVLDAALDWTPGAPSITTTSALEALRMAVGLSPSWGPAGPMDYIAADFNGDGQVTTADALDILRVAVGLPTDQAPRWLFIDSDADLSAVTRSNSQIEPGLRIDAMDGSDHDFGLTGILVGHVQEYA